MRATIEVSRQVTITVDAETASFAVERFLSGLATKRHVIASTQNHALCALLFLYRSVLHAPLPVLVDITRVGTPPRLPVVLSQQEMRSVLDRLDGTPRLVAALLYASGMRLLESLGLRVTLISSAGRSPCARARAARIA